MTERLAGQECVRCGNFPVPSGSPVQQRLDTLAELVVFLVGVAGMQRDTIDQWWTDDWNHEVDIENADWLALLNELIPARRTF